MNPPKRNRARVLTPEGLKKLRERLRSHENEHNAGCKYSLEKLGELTGLDPETVRNVRDGKKVDKSSIARCFESFGLALADGDHIPVAQASPKTADPNFVGRDEAIADLNTLISRNSRVIVIQARGGVGKTTLARKYLQQEFGTFLEFPIAKETKDIASIEGLLEEKLRQLGEEPGREFLVSLDRLKRKLQAERIGILIDNLEPALDSAGKFIEAHRRYVELLRVLSDPSVQSLTLITSRERLREADVTVQHYPLRSLAVTAWEQFFQSRSINTETPAVSTLHNAYGGNAKAMDLVSGAVLEDFSGTVEAYWQANQDDLFIERDLEDLVTKQFDRLQQLDPDAYKLLCRMGCYRYQDVPTVPIEGLFCLLWDVPENRHRRVIKSLQDRSLVDCENGVFWLHSVIRAEAIVRLRLSTDLKEANRRAAEFWIESVTSIKSVKDAIQGLEAYYHYVAIRNYELACEVIIQRRRELVKKQNGLQSAQVGQTLGSSLCQFGLMHQLIPMITNLTENLSPSYQLGKLLSRLGDLYWRIGDLRKSILLHEHSGKIAIDFGIQELEIDSLSNIGVCRVNLWEIEEAIELFQKVEVLARVPPFNNRLAAVYSYLSFLNSLLNRRETSSRLAQTAYIETLNAQGHAWGKGYGMFFLGFAYQQLGLLDQSFEMYTKTVNYAEESFYPQVKAKGLCGLAELDRMKREFSHSLSKNLESLGILEKMGAKCDLAEAYYQAALTYQAMGETHESNINFQQAIRLFHEMEAPKQVQRVRQSMQN